MVMDNETWVGVNTSRTNKLVKEAIENGQIAEFQKVDSIATEVKISEKSRLDLRVLQGEVPTFIEIKNCSLARDNCAMFPDAVTARGTKHLHELISLREQGIKSCIFYLVQRTDADHFRPATHIDPVYSKTLAKAYASGVQLLVYQADVSTKEIRVVRRLPCNL